LGVEITLAIKGLLSSDSRRNVVVFLDLEVPDWQKVPQRWGAEALQMCWLVDKGSPDPSRARKVKRKGST